MRRAGTEKAQFREALTVIELSRFCDVSVDWVTTLVDHGALDPLGCDALDWRFLPPVVLRARKARRLTHELGLQPAKVALMLDLMEEHDALARKLAQFGR